MSLITPVSAPCTVYRTVKPLDRAVQIQLCKSWERALRINELPPRETPRKTHGYEILSLIPDSVVSYAEKTEHRTVKETKPVTAHRPNTKKSTGRIVTISRVPFTDIVLKSFTVLFFHFSEIACCN